MPLRFDHHAASVSAQRTGLARARSAVMAGYVYFGYWFSRMRA